MQAAATASPAEPADEESPLGLAASPSLGQGREADASDSAWAARYAAFADVWDRVLSTEMAYDPKILRGSFKAGSPGVYGELRPNAVCDLVRACGMTERDVFFDLGSGVGNIAMQVGAMTGCRAVGIELREELHRIGLVLLKRMRDELASVPGLDPCSRVELVHGDVSSESIDFTEATVLLVSNLAFSVSTEQSLLISFYESLKHGARVITMRDLCPRYRRQPSTIPTSAGYPTSLHPSPAVGESAEGVAVAAARAPAANGAAAARVVPPGRPSTGFDVMSCYHWPWASRIFRDAASWKSEAITLYFYHVDRTGGGPLRPVSFDFLDRRERALAVAASPRPGDAKSSPSLSRAGAERVAAASKKRSAAETDDLRSRKQKRALDALPCASAASSTATAQKPRRAPAASDSREATAAGEGRRTVAPHGSAPARPKPAELVQALCAEFPTLTDAQVTGVVVQLRLDVAASRLVLRGLVEQKQRRLERHLRRAEASGVGAGAVDIVDGLHSELMRWSRSPSAQQGLLL